MDDLIERLRRSTRENYERGVTATPCPKALRAEEHACLDEHEGHRCYWTDRPDARGNRHVAFRHKCACGTYWGEGEEI